METLWVCGLGAAVSVVSHFTCLSVLVLHTSCWLDELSHELRHTSFTPLAPAALPFPALQVMMDGPDLIILLSCEM